MKVLWSDFAKRRNIDLKTFQTHVSYNQYVRWCHQRNVEPVTEEEFGFTPTVDTKEEVEEQTESVETIPQIDKLKKLKKSEITDFMTSHSVEYDLTDTKRQLIQKIRNKFGL